MDDVVYKRVGCSYSGSGKCLLEQRHDVRIHFGFLFAEREVRVQLVLQSIVSK